MSSPSTPNSGLTISQYALLTLFGVETPLNYSSITTPMYIDQFLNTTLTGSAHKSEDISLDAFLSSITGALIICLIQLGIFSGLRTLLTKVYQPRCHFVPNEVRMEPLDSGFFSWIKPSICDPINDYYSLGLDSYFFLRYLSILFIFFATIGILNIVILVPINYSGNSGPAGTSRVSGLNKISWSNISPEKVFRLNFHFCCGLITIAWFHCILIYELTSFVNIRQNFLMSESHRKSVSSTTLLIRGIPPCYQDFNKLMRMFSVIPGGVKYVWLAYDYREMERLSNDSRKYVNLIERIITQRIRYKIALLALRNGDNATANTSNWKTNLKLLKAKFFIRLRLISIWFDLMLYLPFLASRKFRLLTFEATENIALDLTYKLNVIEQDRVTLKDRILHDGNYNKFNKAFFQFNYQAGAYIAHQCLLSKTHGEMDSSIVELNPKDVIWSNMGIENIWYYQIKKYSITILAIIIIVGWVVPVSFVGLIAQLPYLTTLIPFFKWLNRLPDVIRSFVSNFIPTLCLTVLTEMVQAIFRYLAMSKGKLTGAEVELDLQKWIFGFLFVQVFLVVTISSGITVIINRLINNPSSIPMLLATDLPKAANFFYSFFVIKGLAFFGANFMRLDALIDHFILQSLIDRTPRETFSRMTELPKIRWGSTYPTYSIYAVIGIVYCIISPLISIVICFVLSLTLIYYKYSLKYIYDYTNVSESFGNFYPNALLHLYSGIYCLEICLIGLFFLAKDVNGKKVFQIQGLIMVLVLLCTLLGHITIQKRFSRLVSYLPILELDEKRSFTFKNPDIHSATPQSSYSDYYRTLFLHDSFIKVSPILWIPKDCFGFSTEEENSLKTRGILTSLDGAIIDSKSTRAIPLTSPPSHFEVT